MASYRDMTEEQIEAEAVRICREASRERARDLAEVRLRARIAYWRENPTGDATYADFLKRVGGVDARDGSFAGMPELYEARDG